MKTITCLLIQLKKYYMISMKKRIKLIFHTAWDLANADKKNRIKQII